MSRVKGLRVLSIFMSFVMMLSGIMVSPSRTNADPLPVLPNSGFEEVANGKPLNWSVISGTVTSSTAVVRGGTYSVVISDSSTTASAGLRSVKMPVTPGKEYEASVYSFNASGSSAFYLEFWDANNTLLPSPNVSNNTTNQWKRLAMTQTAPAGAVNASLRLYSGLGNVGTLYFDDAEFQELAVDPNALLRNGDMETTIDGTPRYWDSIFGGDITSSQERKRSGQFSAKLNDPSATAGIGLRSLRMKVTPGVKYDADVFVYVESGTFNLFLEFWDAANNSLPIVNTGSTIRNEWSQIRSSGIAPPTAAYATVRLYSGGGNQGIAYFDDARFAETPPEPNRDLNNGTFELLEGGKPRDWRGVDGEVAVSETQAYDGVRSILITNAESMSAGLRSHLLPVSPGVEYTSKVYALTSAGAAELKMEFWNADKVFLSSVSQAGSTSQVWEAIALAAEIPDQTAYITLRLGTLQPAGGTVYFDAATFKSSGNPSKTRTTLYTPEKVATARMNVQEEQWAKNLKDTAVSKADHFLSKGLDFLWNSVPNQSLPRSYAVNQALGSPVSTAEQLRPFGNYPYIMDPINDPWKIKDPVTMTRFPSNDFESFYRSGLDEHGMFKPELADRSKLINELYPDQAVAWGVDDGTGWVNGDNKRFTMMAYYVHFMWYGDNSLIQRALNAFRDAYLYTGDIRYARAGTVLLDRVADVYPDMDISKYNVNTYLNASGKSFGNGKVLGGIWETDLVKSFISAYDAFFPAMDDPEIVQFLEAKSTQYRMTNGKNSGADIRRNIEDGIIEQIYPGVKKTQILGNDGMHQSSLAMAAVVYDTLPETKEWLDFIFQTGSVLSNPARLTGGNILNSIVSSVDRDGNGDESSAFYNSLWLQAHRMTADILDGYDLYPEADLYKNVKFRKMFSALSPLIQIENYTANIGDTGSAGKPFIIDKLTDAVKAYEKFGDPYYAQFAYFLNNNTSDGIHSDVFAPNPDAIADQIDEVIRTKGPLRWESVNQTGYGYTALRDGSNPKADYGERLSFTGMNVSEQSVQTKYNEATGSIQLMASQDGESATFEFHVPAADDYELELLPLKSASSGIYRISVDGQPVKDMDFYGADLKRYESITRMNLTQGNHTITFEGIGKSSLSSGFAMEVRVLNPLNAEARALRDAQTGAKNTLRDTWMFYGRNLHHGHRDTLNIGLHAFGLDLSPELGYPEFADNNDKHRAHWVNNTVSHNTVVVDKQKQKQNEWAAEIKHFDDSEMVKLIDVESTKVYQQTSLYKRTTAMIKADEENSYSVDLFRVKGGNDHYFSFHGAEGTVTTEGLNLIPQETGTYTRPDVEWGVTPPDDDQRIALYEGSGFHYLKNVETDASPMDSFSVDWQVKDTWNVLGQGVGSATDIHLKLTMLGGVNDVALADGIPPRNRPGNPASLRYLIAQNTGSALDSLFTSIIQPYKGEEFISAITPLTVRENGQNVTSNDVRAVSVKLKNGRTDYIFSALDTGKIYTAQLPDSADSLEFKGSFGLYSVQEDGSVSTYLHDGSYIGKADEFRLVRNGAVTGTVADFTKSLSPQNEITVDVSEGFSENPADLIGKSILIQNDGIRYAAYRIKGVTVLDGGRLKLDIGDITLVRSFKDSNDFSKGYIYDIAEGAAFRIPLTYVTQPLGDASFSADIAAPTNTDVIVTISYPSEAAVKEYKAGASGEWTAYTAPVAISVNESVYARSMDAEGQVSKVTSFVVSNIDKTSPTTTDDGPASAANQDVTVNLSAGDSESGVAATYYTVDGGAVQTGTSVVLTDEGVHSLVYWSVDLAGNIEEQHTKTVIVDKTAPSLTVQLDPTSIWPPNHQMVTIHATLGSSDATSGVASVVLTSITSNEPDSGNGDIDAAIGTEADSFQLRAERSGSGPGRIYTVTYTSTDRAGNHSVVSETVTVPHAESGN
ncbi:OmpL47-type beta-barrel domain-containing protein [Cohnella suwonensis]|uniref:OmpL47-type beta-barrel domain-containing protein n=1 Tax=Cohnella suwonensis TaxID=696072 RepID=A0ABW0M0Z3_9BACL